MRKFWWEILLTCCRGCACLQVAGPRFYPVLCFLCFVSHPLHPLPGLGGLVIRLQTRGRASCTPALQCCLVGAQSGQGKGHVPPLWMGALIRLLAKQQWHEPAEACTGTCWGECSHRHGPGLTPCGSFCGSEDRPRGLKLSLDGASVWSRTFKLEPKSGLHQVSMQHSCQLLAALVRNFKRPSGTGAWGTCSESNVLLILAFKATSGVLILLSYANARTSPDFWSKLHWEDDLRFSALSFFSWYSSDFSKSYQRTFFIELSMPWNYPWKKMLLKYQRILNEKKYQWFINFLYYLRDSVIYIWFTKLFHWYLYICSHLPELINFYTFLLAQTNIHTYRSFFLHWNKIILYTLHCLMISSGHKLVRSQYT